MQKHTVSPICAKLYQFFIFRNSRGGDFKRRVRVLFAVVPENRSGEQARCIPPMAEVNPEYFGVSIDAIDGQQLGIGDCQTDFSIQSTCKPFDYCIALDSVGAESVHRHIGREPSKQRFNGCVLEDDARPHNPMMSAGAIMPLDRLHESGGNTHG